MTRTKPSERARKRVLDDSEVRDLWKALDQAEGLPAPYAHVVRFLLLTACRRGEAAELHAREIDGDVWTIPGERYKNKSDHVVPLSAAARAIIGNGGPGYIFSIDDGKTPINSFSRAKVAIDAEINKIRKAAGRPPMPAWVFHDLRRTARSFMSRAGVRSDHAERALGHTIGGVVGVYDRHEYLSEKRDAFAKLAAIINDIRGA
jgi:integrase